jgi:flagellar biosynthetic protein FliR
VDFIDAIQPHIAPALLAIFRIGGLFIFGPLLSSSAIPVRVRVFLTFILGLAVYPALPAVAGTQPSINEWNLWAIGAAIAMEVTLGAVVGFLAGLPLMAARTGGLIMGQQMGLGFAQFFDPTLDDESDVVGQTLYLLALGGFLIVGGHEQMLLAVLNTFNHIPLGSFAIDADLVSLTCGMMLSAFEVALRVAAPLLALVFLESIAMGFLAKTVPQLNILSLGFPIRILAGLLIIAVGLAAIDAVLLEAVDDAMASIHAWVESA